MGAQAGWRKLPLDCNAGGDGSLAGTPSFRPISAGRRTKMFTRNQSNGDSVNKLMSNKFPLRAVIMEKSGQMEQLGARVDLPRSGGRVVQLQTSWASPHGTAQSSTW